MLLDNDDFSAMASMFSGRHFRNPPRLEITKSSVTRVLIVGSCMSANMVSCFDCEVDYILFNGGVVENMPRDINEYDFQICQIPLRYILEDDTPLAKTRWMEGPDHERLFHACAQRLRDFVERALQPNPAGQRTAYFINFLVPTLNPTGRLLPRHNLANIQYFISKLNHELEIILNEKRNCYIVDADQIANSIGKMYISDEFLFFYSHGSVFYLVADGDGARMERTPPTFEHFHVINPSTLFEAIAAEILAMNRSVLGIDAIKMVVVDLDDTLWRGAAGEMDWPADDESAQKSQAIAMIEGWPLGVIEALMYLRRRGIILGIISRNDENFIRNVFNVLFNGKIMLDDFAVKYINFDEKTESMVKLLKNVNLLPNSVLYIDDNPVEREKMSARFPDMRIIGKHFQWNRHLLLNAPELQLPRISNESAQRNAAIAQQNQRGPIPAGATDQDFLTGLELTAQCFELGAQSPEAKIARCIELVNKTNQWNSTGEKLDYARFERLLASGGRIFGFTVGDRLSHYGDVGFLLLQDDVILQFVMSCRAAGLRLEASFLAKTLEVSGLPALTLRFEPTGKNIPFQLFAEQFPKDGAQFRVTPDLLPDTGHIRYGAAAPA